MCQKVNQTNLDPKFAVGHFVTAVSTALIFLSSKPTAAKVLERELLANCVDLILLWTAHCLRHGLFKAAKTLQEVLDQALQRSGRDIEYRYPDYSLTAQIRNSNIILNKTAPEKQGCGSSGSVEKAGQVS